MAFKDNKQGVVDIAWYQGLASCRLGNPLLFLDAEGAVRLINLHGETWPGLGGCFFFPYQADYESVV